jgi:hypothetical protein
VEGVGRRIRHLHGSGLSSFVERGDVGPEGETGASTQDVQEAAVVPGPDEYLSFLMGADAITEAELAAVGVRILERHGTAARELLLPASSVPAYLALVRERLSPGFWNEVVGHRDVLFVFRLADGTVVEHTLSEDTAPEIARLCSALNGDPLERTSDVLGYLAGNALYRDLIAARASDASR